MSSRTTAAAVLLAASAALAQEGPPLEAWIASALERNPARSLSRAALLSAEAEQLSAGSLLLPTLRAQATYTRNQHETVVSFPDFSGGPPTEVVISPRDQVEAILSAQVPLVDAPGIYRWRAARRAAEAAREDDRASDNDVALAVARSYYAAVAAHQVLRAADRNKAVAEENYRVASVRVKEGAATPLLADRADLEVSRAELIVIDAKRNWEAARRALASASGMPEPTALAAPPPSTDVALDEAALLGRAEADRPELAAARIRVQQADLSKRSAWTTFAPRLSANATERITNAAGFTGQAANWAVGVTAEWLLLDFGTRSAALRRERASVLRADAELEQREIAVRDEVHSAWLDVDAARAKLIAARRGDEVSQRAASETRARFNAGTATQLDVIQSARDALQAEVDRIRAEGELAIARLALERAIGAPLAEKPSP